MVTLYTKDTHFNTSTTDCFSRKHCGKRRNCSLRAISFFPTMFSTQGDNLSLFVHFFTVISLSDAKLEEPKIGLSGKGPLLLNPLPDDKF